MTEEKFEEIRIRAEELYKNYNERVRTGPSYNDNFEVWIAYCAFRAGYQDCSDDFDMDSYF